MEEMKKLARVWKLNERRNFWKTHSERDDMVAALLQHAEQNQNFILKKTAQDALDSTKVTPPTDVRSSAAKNRNIQLSQNLRNFCGIKYFSRVSETEELLVNSRFYAFPDSQSHVDFVVDKWRSEDFHLKDELSLQSQAARQSIVASQQAQIGGRVSMASGIKNKVKIVKHRNLATHLMNYSAHPQTNKNTLTTKTVQTFVSVAESDDPITASTCMVAISNIAASEHVRSLLFEINALHKITNVLSHIQGKVAQRAAGLLFYYFSCDTETEDRVYNSCSSFLQAMGSSKVVETRLVALHTLNNLMPCIDRQRVAEITMRVIHATFDASTLRDKTIIQTYLQIMQNMACFSNAHMTLMQLNILELLGKTASFAAKENNSDIGLYVVKILYCFLQTSDNGGQMISDEFVEVLTTLYELDGEIVLAHCTRAATVLSALPAHKDTLRRSNLVRTICHMVLMRTVLTNSLAKEVAKFLCNITLGQTSDQLRRLVEDKVPDTVLKLLKSTNATAVSKGVAVAALQNLLSESNNSIKLAVDCFEPLLKCLRDPGDIGAAQALYNISCVPQCRTTMVVNKVHVKLLENLRNTKELALKSAYLQILVQLSSSNICVLELLEVGLISRLESQLKGVDDTQVWNDISLMLLAVVAYAASDLSMEDQRSIVHILQIICVDSTSEGIVENCANVLKYISMRYDVFEQIDPVVRSILSLCDSEMVVENISHVLYNMTCTARNVELMLKDAHYVNVMIRIMRNGKLEVQENIAQAMRTLCAVDRCTEILLKSDILSDLIVIALLRTSSEEIKVVCSEAFYNMLCHDRSRLQLLRGDLWWAVMRLCRTDSHQVRSICARALFDLSTDPANVAPLRDHHVLTFVKDISSSGSEEFLIKCLQAVHNLVGQFKTSSDPSTLAVFSVDEDALDSKAKSNTPMLSPAPAVAPSGQFLPHEVVSAVRIGVDALSRCKNSVPALRHAILLLLKCSQQPNCEEAEVEFVNIDIVEVLDRSKALWGQDQKCRVYVSQLMWELSRSKLFTKGLHLSEVDPILLTVFAGSPSIEICSNICSFLLQFILEEKTEPELLIKLEVWPMLLPSCLSTETTIRELQVGGENSLGGISKKLLSQSFRGASISTLGTGSGEITTRFGRTTVVDKRNSRLPIPREVNLTELNELTAQTSLVENTRGSMLCLLAYAVQPVISKTPSTLTKGLITGILTTDMLDEPLTRTNLLVTLIAISEVSSLAAYALEAKVFSLLHRFLQNSSGTSKLDKAQEFCSAFLRNISLHSSLVTRFVSHTDGGTLLELIKDLLDAAPASVCLDLSVFFYNSAAFLAKSDSCLNPTFVLDMLNKLSTLEHEQDADISSINKYTISMILNKYNFGAGVDPTYIQYMFTYMQTNQSASTPEFMEHVDFRRIEDLTPVLHQDFLSSKQSTEAELVYFCADEHLWQPTVTHEYKRHENIILKFKQAEPILHSKIETVESSSLTSATTAVFSKILRKYDPLSDSPLKAEASAISEGEEEEEHDFEDLDATAVEGAPEETKTSPLEELSLDDASYSDTDTNPNTVLYAADTLPTIASVSSAHVDSEASAANTVPMQSKNQRLEELHASSSSEEVKPVSLKSNGSGFGNSPRSGRHLVSPQAVAAQQSDSQSHLEAPSPAALSPVPPTPSAKMQHVESSGGYSAASFDDYEES